MPLTTNAVTLRRCQVARSSRSSTAIFVGNVMGASVPVLTWAVLYVVHMELVTAWRPRVPGIAEVFHAQFVDHAYPPHVHDAWTLLIVDEGAIRFDLDRHHRGAAGASVTLLPPNVAHDGRAATGDGFRKRVLYLDTTSCTRASPAPPSTVPASTTRCCGSASTSCTWRWTRPATSWRRRAGSR